jgi:hypothetical protein
MPPPKVGDLEVVAAWAIHPGGIAFFDGALKDVALTHTAPTLKEREILQRVGVVMQLRHG